MITVNINSEAREIKLVKYVNLTIKKIAKGAKIIWLKISSCFGSGIWVEDNYWSNVELWVE